MSRPGQVLSDIYQVSRTTISRIKKGENHIQWKQKYELLPLEERREMFDTFCDGYNLLYKKAVSSKLVNKRKLTKEQVFLIYLNEELSRPKSLVWLMNYCHISSSNTIYCLLKGQTYNDYWLEYKQLTLEQKESLATLLRN